MNGAHKCKVLSRLFLAVFIISFVSIGCENPGSVGGGIDDSEIAISDTTIAVSNVTIDSVNAFSGGLSRFSAGIFDDPLFGGVKATPLIKPTLLNFTDSLRGGTVMKLRMGFNKEEFYGDSLAQADFDLVEIDELWRAKAWKYNNEVPLSNNPPIGSFSISDEDSVEVTLDPNWVEKYRDIYNNPNDSERDSLYRFDFFGFAIVPQNDAKIVAFNSINANFALEETLDTTIAALGNWATSIERTTSPTNSAETIPVYSTLEKVMSFKMDLTAEEFGTSINISQVELILPVDIETMQQSLNQQSSNLQRPGLNIASLYLFEPDLISDALGRGSPIAQGSFVEADSSFHFNITSFVNGTIIDGVNDNQRFYITIAGNNGFLRSALIFNDAAPANKQPKLIITSIKSDEL